VLRTARREPSSILLAAQLAGVLLYPFAEGSHAGRALFSVLGIVILEQVGGLAYVAMLVSRLVGLTVFRRREVK
jgi:hypothetical protein